MFGSVRTSIVLSYKNSKMAGEVDQNWAFDAFNDGSIRKFLKATLCKTNWVSSDTLFCFTQRLSAKFNCENTGNFWKNTQRSSKESKTLWTSGLVSHGTSHSTLFSSRWEKKFFYRLLPCQASLTLVSGLEEAFKLQSEAWRSMMSSHIRHITNRP